MLTTDMLSILACPVCHARLRANIKTQQGQNIIEGALLCSSCERKYEVLSGIPNLMPAEINSSDEWQLWTQHLKAFDARRHFRAQHAIKLPHPSSRSMHSAFFEFAKIKEGLLLDVGCGPGKLRKYVDESKVTYWGLDPLQIEDTLNFRFVHALGEYLPFQDATFSHVMVISALDHFNDLDRFFREARRVLKKQGTLLILQSTHEVTGPVTLVKMLAHYAKDKMDSLATRRQHTHAPKHLHEFTRASLLQALHKNFALVRQDSYSAAWYSPTKMFLALRPAGVPAENELSRA